LKSSKKQRKRYDVTEKVRKTSSMENHKELGETEKKRRRKVATIGEKEGFLSLRRTKSKGKKKRKTIPKKGVTEREKLEGKPREKKGAHPKGGGSKKNGVLEGT